MNAWETDDTFLARWLSGELTEQEQQEFETSEDYELYVRTVADMDQLEVGPYEVEGSFDRLKARIHGAEQGGADVRDLKPRRSPNRIWYYALAASILLIGIIWWQWGGIAKRPPLMEVIATEQMDITLPDASQVQLQPGSLLRYDSTKWGDGEEREIFLQGQAYFDVAAGSLFEVELEQGSVEVLGTRFQVREANDTLEVSCYEGKVRVEAFDTQEIPLNAGQTARFVKGVSPALSTTSLQQPSWLSPVIQLTDTPLQTVLIQLSEIYGVRFLGAVEEKELFSGAYPTNDLEVALQQVLGPFGLTYDLDIEQHVVIIN